MNTGDLIAILLLALFVAALTAGALMVFLSRRWRPAHRTLRAVASIDGAEYLPGIVSLPRPNLWLVVRSRRLSAVQSAMRLHNARPCSWTEGMANDQKVFIAPPVNGWILVMGSGLPDPADDVDACFRFLLNLSRRLGKVQFFNVNRVLGHHAWVRAQSGRIVRAYAWAGRTVWNQGARTLAERELGLRCFPYLENVERMALEDSEILFTNTERVPLLAARWSFDPGAIEPHALEHTCGVTGEAPRLY